MTKKKLWVIAGVIGAASIGAVPALTAQAYPPGADLTIVAAAVAGVDGKYHVTITNIKPGCKYEVESRGVEKEGTFIGPGDGFGTRPERRHEAGHATSSTSTPRAASRPRPPPTRSR